MARALDGDQMETYICLRFMVDDANHTGMVRQRSDTPGSAVRSRRQNVVLGEKKRAPGFAGCLFCAAGVPAFATSVSEVIRVEA